MSQDDAGNQEALRNLAQVLREQTHEEPKSPAVTDRHILCAVLGRPWSGPPQEPAAEVRKAG
jgi:hypothetical protein